MIREVVRKQILIVADDSAILELLRVILSNEGYEILTCCARAAR